MKWQGVDHIDELGNFSADEVVAIYDSQMKIFAVGALAIGSQDLKAMDKPEGNAAFILHFKGDTLYDLGDKQ